MPIFRSERRRDENEHEPTTAELRETREQAWQAVFGTDASADDYRRQFLRHSPLSWEVVQSTQRDLLRLLIGRVPAELGVPAIFGLTVVLHHHPKAEDAARAVLAMIVHDLQPAYARTVLASLADAWHNAERRPYDERGRLVAGEVERALRRLLVAGADDMGVISAIYDHLQVNADGTD